ncbi:hypothetical protein [Actinomyces lilanjuaniae]|uniref:hypothetical protein n=1 Tax=Actinomyces lilanjuaniae TaxID=2321394 RepID=UPI0019694C9E|nr:hypothetical protein [Actinomyces lilanjuaniae]
MLSVVVSVLVALVALVVVVAVVHRGSGPRTRLLQLAAASMCLAALAQEAEVVYGDQVVVDLVKRLVFLVMLVSVMVLVMTFRRGGLSRRAAWRVAGRARWWAWWSAWLRRRCRCVRAACSTPTTRRGSRPGWGSTTGPTR